MLLLVSSVILALVPFISSDAIRCRVQGHQLFCLAVKLSPDGLNCITNMPCGVLVDKLRSNRSLSSDYIFTPPNPYRDPEVRVTAIPGNTFVVLLDHSGFSDSSLSLPITNDFGCSPIRVLDDPYSPNQECYSSGMIYIDTSQVNIQTNFILEKSSFKLNINDQPLITFRVSNNSPVNCFVNYLLFIILLFTSIRITIHHTVNCSCCFL